jgi:hypothetical protein
MDKAIEKLFDNVKEVHFETKHRVTQETKKIQMLIMIGDEPCSRNPLAFRDLCIENQRIIMDKIEEYLAAHYFHYQFQRVTAVNEIPDTEKQRIRTMYKAS